MELIFLKGTGQRFTITTALKLDKQTVDLSLNNFYEAINAVLDKHAPYHKVGKYASKLKTKP